MLADLHKSLQFAMKTFLSRALSPSGDQTPSPEALIDSFLDSVIPTSRSFGGRNQKLRQSSPMLPRINTVAEHEEFDVTNPMVDENMHNLNLGGNSIPLQLDS